MKKSLDSKIFDRVQTLKENEIKKDRKILYICRRDKRIFDNPALEYANSLSSHVIMVIIPELLIGNYRQKIFISECLQDLHKMCQNKIPFLILDRNELNEIIDSFKITDIILDYSPLRENLQFDLELKKIFSQNIYRVDAHNIIPHHCVPDNVKSGYAVKKRLLEKYPIYYTNREREMLKFDSKLCEEVQEIMNKKINKEKSTNNETFWKKLIEKFTDNLKISENDNNSEMKSKVSKVIEKYNLNSFYEKKFIGSRKEAIIQINHFKENKLSQYEKYRNNVDMDVLSGISPYVNCGIVSSQEVINRVSDVGPKKVVGAGIKNREFKDKMTGGNSSENNEINQGGKSRTSLNTELSSMITYKSEKSTDLNDTISEKSFYSTTVNMEEDEIEPEKTGEISFTKLSNISASDKLEKDKITVNIESVSSHDQNEMKESRKPDQKKKRGFNLISSSDAQVNINKKTRLNTKKGKRPLRERIKSNAPHLNENDQDILTYLNEIFIWKETADYYVSREKEYDNFKGAPLWAKNTLDEHRTDKRVKISFEKIILGETNDREWNAAQKQMIITGKMHGYARMYWAKKIHSWLLPEQAVSLASVLNDTFNLDGNDPNGYLGVMWSTVGVMDQGFAEQPYLGKVRGMKSLKGNSYVIKWNKKSFYSKK